VMFSVFTEGETVPFTFCLVDRQARCLVVTLYNLSPGKGVIIGRMSGCGIKINNN
jgi:hypothetical protein